MTILMIISCVYPGLGAFMSGVALGTVKTGQAVNINVKVAKTTLVINIILTVLFLVRLLPNLM